MYYLNYAVAAWLLMKVIGAQEVDAFERQGEQATGEKSDQKQRPERRARDGRRRLVVGSRALPRLTRRLEIFYANQPWISCPPFVR